MCVIKTRTTRDRRPYAFTLVELLVVIAIIGVMVGFIAASQYRLAREAARRNELR